MDFGLKDQKYRVHCKISSKIRAIDMPVYESCDLIVCVKAHSDDGERIEGEEWKKMLDDAGAADDFWAEALSTYVYATVCLELLEPGQA